jgi:hypothetical protein
MGQLAFYVLDEFCAGELASVEAREISWLDPIPGSRIPFVAVAVAESASVVRWERVERLTEASVEVVDVLGCEGSGGGAVVSEGRRLGIREGFEVGKEVMMEREVV